MENKLFLKGILETKVDVSTEVYQKDFEGLAYKVNWDVTGEKGSKDQTIKAYQIYEQNEYTYKLGESLGDADLTISFFAPSFIKRLMGREKMNFEMGKYEGNYILQRKDVFITTRSKTKNLNAQMLITKMPFFRWVVPDFGASRLSRPLRIGALEEFESSGEVDKIEIVSLLKKMLSESVDTKDDIYQKDFKGQILKVNWEIDGITAYQVFEETSYKYEFGKLLDDADLTLVIDNLKQAKRFLRKDPSNFAGGLDADDNFLIYMKIPVAKLDFKDKNTHSSILSKLPLFRAISKLAQGPPEAQQEVKEVKKKVRENFGGYIPINKSLGEYENVVIPFEVFKHFIDKASNIILRTCPCRERGECKDHTIELGCIFMGDDTFNMAVTEDQGYVATKEQALEHTRKAIDNGLIPLIGRNIAEAEGSGVKDTGHFLSCCFCCTCCCVGAKGVEYGTSAGRGKGMVKRIKGLELILDSAKCNGCETCVDVCYTKAREIIDGKSVLDKALCMGCGRCVDTCPEGAISLSIEDPSYLDEFISKIESIVDVEKQQEKIVT